MGAFVLDGMEGAANIEKRHIRALKHDTGGLSGRKFFGANGFHGGILGVTGVGQKRPRRPSSRVGPRTTSVTVWKKPTRVIAKDPSFRRGARSLALGH